MLSDDLIQIMFKDYVAGLSLRDLAKKYQQPIKQICNGFKRLNLHKDKQQIQEERKKKQTQTSLERFGVTHHFKLDENKKYGADNPMHRKEIKDKIKHTNQEKYGVDWYLKTANIKRTTNIDKRKQTCLKRYGVDNPMKVDEVKEKQVETCLKRYGVKTPLKLPHVKKARIKGSLEIYKTENPFKSSKFIRENVLMQHAKKQTALKTELLKDGYEILGDYNGIYHTDVEGKYLAYKQYTIRHLKCNKTFKDDIYILPRCPYCYSDPCHSAKELNYKEYIEGIINKEVIHSDKLLINPQSNNFLTLDMLIPEMNIAFEYNSLFYHSRYDRNYHALKTKLCAEKNIKLFHIWEFHDKEIIKSKIAFLLKSPDIIRLSARNLAFRELTRTETDTFFDAYHLYGTIHNSSYNYGLFKDTELIIAISFRHNEDMLEIARLCTKNYTTVNGGFSKLFKHALTAIKEKEPDINSILTYADKDWTPIYQDSIYYKYGFTLLGDSGPSMFYTKNHKIYARQLFMKYKLAALFPKTYRADLTEQEIMKLEGFNPIYTSGNWKFVIRI